MNKYCIYLLILLSSCISQKDFERRKAVINNKKITIIGTNLKCLSDNDIKALILKYYPNSNLTTFNIGAVAINQKECLGLFQFQMYDYPLSKGVNHVALKFKDNITPYNKTDSLENLKIIDEFEAEYSKFFSQNQLDTIRIRFLEGSKLYGRHL